MSLGARRINPVLDAVPTPGPKHVRSATFFFAANILTGFLNYFFQVTASKSLSAAEFSNLNAWFADLALLFFLGGIVQYYGIFFPARRASLRRAVLGINILALGVCVLWYLSPPGQSFERGILIFTGSTAFAWLMGQIQYRKMFAAVGIANLLMGATKLSLVIIPLITLVTVERFRLAYFANYLPALWLISLVVWRLPDEPIQIGQKRNTLQLWMAPVILSLASAVIPQMDMVIISRVMGEEAFHSFARSSLFARGIYFVFLILAQWMLPFQLQGEMSSLRHRLLNPLLAAMTVISAGVIAGLSPLLIDTFLHWDVAPTQSLVFLSCLNMNLLTWLFLLVQKSCAQGQTKRAATAFAGLALEAAVQFSTRPSSNGYFLVAILFQSSLIWFLSQSTSRSATSRT